MNDSVEIAICTLQAMMKRIKRTPNPIRRWFMIREYNRYRKATIGTDLSLEQAAQQPDKLYQTENCCPKCNSQELEWDDQDLVFPQAYYDFTCKSCGTRAREWHDLVYSCTKIL